MRKRIATADGASVRRVAEFTPFRGVDEQEHSLFIGDDELLRIDSEALVRVESKLV